MQISAISFDGDMTLWDFYKVMRHSLTHILRELRRYVPIQHALDLTVEDMIAIRTNDMGIKADYAISSLTDLPAILGVGRS